MSDEFRDLARAGLAPLVDDLPPGPEWEDLVTSPVSENRPPAPRWLVAVLAAVLVFGLVGVSLLVPRTESHSPSDSSSTSQPFKDLLPEFDPVAAEIDAEIWWGLVTTNLDESAAAMSHSQHSYDTLDLRSALSTLGPGVTIDVFSEPFGSGERPQLCWIATGLGDPRTGSVVFRRDVGEWRIWEVRTDVEQCLVGSEPPPIPPEVTTLKIVQPVPIRVFTASGNTGPYSFIDLDTGTIITYPPGTHVISGFAGAVMDDERRLVVWSYEPTVWVFDKSMMSPFQTLQQSDLTGLGPELRAVSTGDTEGRLDGLWVVDSVQEPTSARLYDLSNRQQLNSLAIPDNGFVVGAWGSNLIFNTETYHDTGDGFTVLPGSEHVLLAYEGGIQHDLGVGRGIGVGANRLARLTCPEEDPGCDLYRSNDLVVSSFSSREPAVRFVVNKPFEGVWMTVGGPMVPSGAMPLATVSPDGQRLLVRLGRDLDVNGVPAYSELMVVDLITEEASTVTTYESETPLATWSSDGRWVVTFQYVEDHRIDVTVIDADNPDNTFTYEDLIPDGQFPFAAG